MTKQITDHLSAGRFDAAISLIETLEIVGSSGARSLRGSEWFDDPTGLQFKVDYSDESAETVQVVGTMNVYHRP
jgi:hypothetical protein